MPVLSAFLISTRFLLTRGSPSVLSAACLLDAVGGPKYDASSFGFFLACGRDLEPEATAPVTEPLADMVGAGQYVSTPLYHRDVSMLFPRR